ISGYRHPCSSAKDCVLSLFQLTNETLNIWTHFLFFLWKLLTVVLVKDDWQDPFTWPFLVFLLSCCLYPLASSCAHTFSTMSERARHICFFFDYGALSFYSLGSAITYSSYSFPDKWVISTFHKYYVPIAVVNSVISTALIFVCNGEGCTVNEASTVHYQHTSLAVLTGFLFATHLPERLAPGSFDYIGHSHQLFHVFAIIGTHFQMTQWLHAQYMSSVWDFSLLEFVCLINVFVMRVSFAFSTSNHMLDICTISKHISIFLMHMNQISFLQVPFL
uniref:Progestin and adipoQ receptor family member Va n=1 Tax=Sinocyclocheilus rhinocerous TaxID=307959 RepID=A0A673MZ57_9TELE